MAILELEDLKVEYQASSGYVRAVERGTLDVAAGTMLGLVGESGCGKTTLVRAITGVMARNARITQGAIRFDRRDITHAGAAERRALLWRDIAFIPQSAMNALDPVYRVSSQMREVLIERGGLSRAEAAQRIDELFAMVGLDRRRQRDFPHQFSGGMRQRVGIALALALRPKLLIADEPVTALDVIVQRQVLDTLIDLQRRFQLSVILVTHDISVVAYACDRIAVMYAGQIVEAGATEEVLERPVHPYTMGLTNAFPDLARAEAELVPIPGSPPDLVHAPAGCRFEPRCPFALPRCAGEDPPLARLKQDHRAACWRASDAPALRSAAQEVGTWLSSSR